MKEEEKLGTEISFDRIKPYVHLSAEEQSVLDRLQNNTENKELWTKEDLNILAKAVIVTPDSAAYLGMLKLWLETYEQTENIYDAENILEKEADIISEYYSIIMGNIWYQLSQQNDNQSEKALEYAIQHDFRDFAMQIVFDLLDGTQSYTNIIAQKNLRLPDYRRRIYLLRPVCV